MEVHLTTSGAVWLDEVQCTWTPAYISDRCCAWLSVGAAELVWQPKLLSYMLMQNVGNPWSWQYRRSRENHFKQLEAQ